MDRDRRPSPPFLRRTARARLACHRSRFPLAAVPSGSSLPCSLVRADYPDRSSHHRQRPLLADHRRSINGLNPTRRAHSTVVTNSEASHDRIKAIRVRRAGSTVGVCPDSPSPKVSVMYSSSETVSTGSQSGRERMVLPEALPSMRRVRPRLGGGFDQQE